MNCIIKFAQYFSDLRCPVPEETESAIPLSMNNTFGDTVTYVCKEGYYHYAGNSDHTRQRNSVWSKSPIVCERKSKSNGENSFQTVSDKIYLKKYV